MALSAEARTITQAEDSLLEAINNAREQYHLHPLVRDSELDRFARKHSDEMIHDRVFEHTKRLAKLPGRVIGENLAWCSSRVVAAQIVAVWLASAPHRANLLRPGFRLVGIGVAAGRLEGVKNGRVVTVDFSGS